MTHENERMSRIDIGREIKMEVDGKEFLGSVLNVSFGGSLLRCDERPSLGATVTLKDEFSGNIQGTVVRHTDEGFALSLGENEESANFALRAISFDMAEAGFNLGQDDETND